MDCRERRREREREREKERERDRARARSREGEDGRRKKGGREKAHLFIFRASPGRPRSARCYEMREAAARRRGEEEEEEGGGRAGGRERGWEGLIRDGRRTVATYVRARRET
jgi:hypothetical protein